MIFGDLRQQTELLKSASATSISTSPGHVVWTDRGISYQYTNDTAVASLRVSELAEKADAELDDE